MIHYYLTTCLIMVLKSIVVLSLIVILTNADYLNYHYAVGIPAAARIRERERRAILGVPDNGSETRVVHGSEVPVSTYPWLAGLVITLQNIKGSSVCGSSLVSSNRLLTAGHCWIQRDTSGTLTQALTFEVVLGSQYIFYGGLRILTNTVVTHPKWTIENNFNGYDAAVIYLPYDVTFSEYIYPINLPTDYIEESFEGYYSIGAGYGVLDDVQRQIGIYPNASIHHVGLTVIANAECVRYYYNIMPVNICTNGFNGVGICQGDSGGPLVTYVNNVPILIGITSASSAEGCEIGGPSIYTRITQILDFIEYHLNTNS